MPRMGFWGRILAGEDWRNREKFKADLLLMLAQCRGPGRGVEIPKHPAHLMRQGKTRVEAEAEIAFWRPMLAAAQQLNNERQDLVIVRYRFSEVLCFRIDLEASVSNVALQDMERTKQVRAKDALIVPGERGVEGPEVYDRGTNNFE